MGLEAATKMSGPADRSVLAFDPDPPISAVPQEGRDACPGAAWIHSCSGVWATLALLKLRSGALPGHRHVSACSGSTMRSDTNTKPYAKSAAVGTTMALSTAVLLWYSLAAGKGMPSSDPT